MKNRNGFSMLELMMVLILIGVFIGFSTFNLRELSNSANNAASDLMGYLKRSRAKALATTRAYTLSAANNKTIQATWGNSCSSPQTPDTAMNYTLPPGASLASTSWSICYNTRGLSNSSANIVVQDANSYKTVQVVLGGGVRVQ